MRPHYLAGIVLITLTLIVMVTLSYISYYNTIAFENLNKINANCAAEKVMNDQIFVMISDERL